jgi:hypothetical protein
VSQAKPTIKLNIICLDFVMEKWLFLSELPNCISKQNLNELRSLQQQKILQA